MSLPHVLPLRSALLLLLIQALLTGMPAMARDNGLIAPTAAASLAETGDIQIIDVRTPAEWAWTGIARKAAKVNWWQPASGFVKGVLAAVDGDRNRPIALICATGVRSSKARRLLLANGFTNVRDIGEGMMGGRAGPGWLARKLPLEK